MKMSAQLIFLEMCFICNVKSSFWNSRTYFSWGLICLGNFVVVVLSQLQHAHLLL